MRTARSSARIERSAGQTLDVGGRALDRRHAADDLALEDGRPRAARHVELELALRALVSRMIEDAHRIAVDTVFPPRGGKTVSTAMRCASSIMRETSARRASSSST